MTNTPPWVPKEEPLRYELISPLVDRDPAVLEPYVLTLRSNPHKRLAWSFHRTRGAARQRVIALRGSRLFKNFPDIRFQTRAALPGHPDKGVYILIHADNNVRPRIESE